MDSPSEADTELHTRLRQQEVVTELGRRALECDDLEQLLHDASVAVAETLDIEYAAVFELRPGGDVVLRRGVGWPAEVIGSATVPANRDSQTGYALRAAHPIIVDDLRTEDRFTAPELLTSRGVVSGISVSIGSVENPWGVLGAHSTEHRTFTERDADFVRSVADVLAPAIENANAERRLRERESELEKTFDRITDGVLGLDENWNVTYLNERAEGLLDLDGRGLVGENFWDPFEPAIGTTFEEEFREAMDTQEPTAFEEYYPPLETWFEVRAYPSETGLSIYFQDVTERKHLQNELEATVNRITDAFYSLDTEWTVTYVNERAEELLGRSADELRGEDLWNVFPEAVDTELYDRFHEAMETQESVTFERYSEPLEFWTEVRVYPSETGLSVYFRDVSERKEQEEELELFRTLLDHSTDSVLVIDPESGRFLDVNDAACRRRGYSREELLERTVPDLQTAIPDLEAWRSYVEDLKSEGQLTFEGQHERKDGSVFPVEINDSYVELDREYVLAISRDITERREYERELEQYRALTQAATDAIVTIDDSSTIQSASPAVRTIFGYEPDELVGERLTVLMSEDLAQRHLDAIGRYLETGEKTLDWKYVEVPGRRRDGSEVPLAISFGEIEHENEHFFTGIIRDVTERKEYERKLEESNERLEQFAYAASHDLQEPLRMITSYLQLVERRYADQLDEDGEEFIAYAVDGAERMRDMIEGLLEYSRVESQGDPFETVELDAVLDDVFADLQLRIDESDAEITTEPLPRVEGDDDQLRQLLQNLLSNAIEYSGDEPPRVRVAAERDGQMWTISVRDEGIGIDLDDSERVFEVFQRLHTRHEHAGTGIGLALCRRIVERHGGEIWVDSEPGESATFSFTLPAAGSHDR